MGGHDHRNTQREQDELAEQAATVSERELDHERWYVHRLTAGDALIVRAIPRPDLLEDEDDIPPELEPPDDPGLDDAWRLRLVKLRRGQRAFRELLLEAYQGSCAVTKTTLPDLLEAAHIIPHSKGKNYRVTNGLLLRADIHTMYDLHHLSIDAEGRIHVSSEAMQVPHYKDLHHQRIQHPELPSNWPDTTSLSSRHREFLRREAERPQLKSPKSKK